ncbi:MAG: selenocysteine-specific translation elongation factor [Proteobacteria bacterium]|nr:selenocysteine-specific translation elongation factor [Pseudomonadota bacterium]
MIIATAGHVDHGKTSLVRQITGIDTDRLEEEKKRGLTIDLGFAYTNLESGKRVGFIDVPGHIRFINNMLAGVSAVDYALFVIAADDGVMPQTIEHLEILELLDIRQGCIALTKIDRCEPSRVEAVEQDIRQLVSRTFLSDAEIFPVSCISGEGIDLLKLNLDIAAGDVGSPADAGRFRLAIDRRFSVHGAGIVVTGSIFSGSVSVGDDVILMPQGVPVRVRGLHAQNQDTDTARAGDRCAVNITGNLELEDISRGNWLTTNRAPATDRVDIRMQLLAGEPKPLRHWTPVHVHSAANHVHGRLALLEGPRLAPGENGLAQLVLDEPINLCAGDRVVIRDQAASRTLGGGRVLDPWSPRRGRARQERLNLLPQIDPLNAGDTLAALLKHQASGFQATPLIQAFNLTDEEWRELLDMYEPTELDNDWLIAAEHLGNAATRMTATLDSWHGDNPSKAGLPRNQIVNLLRPMPAALVNHLIDTLKESGELEQAGNLLMRPGFGIRLSPAEQQIWEKVHPMLSAELTCPPVLHDIAKDLGVAPKQLEKALLQVTKAGLLVRPVKNRFFLPEGIESLKSMLMTANQGEPFTVIQFRDATGIGRNLCIEILEYFDRQGITRRTGDTRQIIKP